MRPPFFAPNSVLEDARLDLEDEIRAAQDAVNQFNVGASVAPSPRLTSAPAVRYVGVVYQVPVEVDALLRHYEAQAQMLLDRVSALDGGPRTMAQPRRMT